MLSDRCLSVLPVYLFVLSETLVYCDQTVGLMKMRLGTKVGLGLGNIVLNGDPAPLPQKGHIPNSAHVSCGQTAGWIKMPLGTEVGLGLGDTVLHGDTAPPLFGPCPGLKVRRVAPGRRPGTLWSAGSLPGLSISDLQLQGVSAFLILQPFYRASYASPVLGVVILSVRPPVCPSVRHTRAL